MSNYGVGQQHLLGEWHFLLKKDFENPLSAGPGKAGSQLPLALRSLPTTWRGSEGPVCPSLWRWVSRAQMALAQGQPGHG